MRRLAAALGASMLAAPALAACPVELAVYGDRDGAAEIDFRPAGDIPSASNAFKIILEPDIVLEGMVLWTEGGAARPTGVLHHGCPDGDATGEELAACTVWQGVIYSVDAEGGVGLMPRQGAPAPAHLVFSDLAASLAAAPALDGGRPARLPFDVFSIKGCQE